MARSILFFFDLFLYIRFKSTLNEYTRRFEAVIDDPPSRKNSNKRTSFSLSTGRAILDRRGVRESSKVINGSCGSRFYAFSLSIKFEGVIYTSYTHVVRLSSSHCTHISRIVVPTKVLAIGEYRLRQDASCPLLLSPSLALAFSRFCPLFESLFVRNSRVRKPRMRPNT